MKDLFILLNALRFDESVFCHEIRFQPQFAQIDKFKCTTIFNIHVFKFFLCKNNVIFFLTPCSFTAKCFSTHFFQPAGSKAFSIKHIYLHNEIKQLIPAKVSQRAIRYCLLRDVLYTYQYISRNVKFRIENFIL